MTRFPVFFSGRVQRIVWDIWSVYPAITGQFAPLLRKAQLHNVDAATNQLERFVVLLYDKSCTRSYIDVFRFDLHCICKQMSRCEQHSTNIRCIYSSCEESNMPRCALVGSANRNTNDDHHHRHHQVPSS